MTSQNNMGSRITAVYTADDGTLYHKTKDKSNALSAGWQQYTILTNSTALPQGLEPRYVLCYHPLEFEITRRIEVGTQTEFLTIIGQRFIALPDPIGESTTDTVNFIVTFYSGEKGRLPTVGDTGLDDP